MQKPPKGESFVYVKHKNAKDIGMRKISPFHNFLIALVLFSTLAHNNSYSESYLRAISFFNGSLIDVAINCLA